MRFLCAVAATLFVVVGPASAQSRGSRPAPVYVTTQVRSLARKLATDWVDKASPVTLDQLAQRSIAFAGMVSSVNVTLDGKRLSATKALSDSALTILGGNDHIADAGAIRNIVYTLMEIAGGRTTKGK